MEGIKKGNKYVVMIYNKDNSVSFKNVICKGFFTNFNMPQMEIETTEGEYYPFSDVYLSEEHAIKENIKHLRSLINVLEMDIKRNEKQIQEDKKRIKEIKTELASLLKNIVNAKIKVN